MVITKKFRINQARRFIDRHAAEDYYFIASHGDISLKENYHDEILAFKKSDINNCTHGIKRINWESGTVYDPHGEYFYAMNSNSDVYICVDNNNNSVSVEEPVSKIPETFVLEDGYRWKYMYTINQNDILNFLTDDFIPVRNVENNSDGNIGANNIEELNAHYVIVNMTFENNENGDFPVDMEYKRIGIISNPIENDTGNVANNITYRQTDRLELNNISGVFESGENLTIAGDIIGNVVQYDSTNSVLLIKSYEKISNGQTISGENSISSAEITSIQVEEIRPNSGLVIFYDDKNPIPRSSDQTEKFVTVFEF